MLLTFLIVVLLGDMDILPFKLLHFEGQAHNEKSIGTVLQTKQNVRRRSNSAIFWENTKKADNLYNYDSILTLENSSSEIYLDGDIKLQLHENTLVVLEPKNDTEQGAFKIRFDRGDMRSRGSQRFRVGTGEWVIEASQGADLSVKSITGENIEVEVHGGQAIVQNGKTNDSRQIEQGQRALLNANEAPNVKTVSEDLKFMDRLYQRLYSHTFPVEFKVAWKGLAKKLRVLTPGKNVEYIDLTEADHERTLSLSTGSYYFTLESDKEISESLALHVWPAEKISYFTPLPRDRVQTGIPNTYAWSEIEAAEKYHVHFSSGEAFESRERQHDISLVTEGEMEWSVYAEDDEGFLIPPPYGYPIYSVPDPLAPPELIEPKLRTPANEEKYKKATPDQGSILQKIFSFFIPTANAKAPYKGDLIFEWSQVPGADFYTIEISSNPDFQAPEVIVNAESEKFVWQNYAREIYYWRVAGGQKGGRMGLFSKIQKLNLKNLDSITGAEVSPGVKLVRHLKIGPPVKINKPIAKPNPVDVPRIVPSAQAPIEKKNIDFNFDVGFYYDYSQLKASSDVVANFNGFRPYNLGFEAVIPTANNDALSAKINYNYIIWKADPEDKYPFQPKLPEHRYGLTLHYRTLNTPWSYGLRIEQLSYPERVDLEEIQLKSLLFYGVSGSYFIPNSVFDLSSKHTGNLLIADGQMQFQLMNEFLYRWDLFSRLTTDMVLELNLKYFSGSQSQSGFLGQFGIFIRSGF